MTINLCFNYSVFLYDNTIQDTHLKRVAIVATFTNSKNNTNKYNSQISIHSPHARRDMKALDFQRLHYNFNPLSSCEERHFFHIWNIRINIISIHSPHARRDQPVTEAGLCSAIFQSTLLMRGETTSSM